MNRFIRDFIYTFLYNSFLSIKFLPKFDKRTKPIRNTGLRFGIEKKYLLDFLDMRVSVGLRVPKVPRMFCSYYVYLSNSYMFSV